MIMADMVHETRSTYLTLCSLRAPNNDHWSSPCFVHT